MARSDEDDDESEVGCCTKYTIFVLNVLFFLAGFAMLAIGVYCQVDDGGMYKKLQSQGNFALDPTILLIFIGIITFIIGFFGCLGALRENTCLLTIYAIALGIIIALQIVIFVILYFYKETAMETVGDFLKQMIPEYTDNEDLQEMMDQIQMTMKCCGIKSPDDWDSNPYYMKVDKNATQPPPDAGGVPYSCCIQPYQEKGDSGDINSACGRMSRIDGLNNKIFNSGCLDAIDLALKTNGLTFLIIAAVIFIMQTVALMMAQNLKSDIKAQKAKWFS